MVFRSEVLGIRFKGLGVRVEGGPEDLRIVQ